MARFLTSLAVFAVFACLPAGTAVNASASPHLRGIEVQELVREGRKQSYVQVRELKRAPAARTWPRIRAMITVENDPGKAVEGLVLRYVAVAKLKKVGSSDEGVWVLPFRLEERRIPRLSAGALKRVPIDTIRLEVYLRELRRTGYWPETLKIQVMMQPKPGVPLEKTMIEADFPVAWD